MADNVNGCRKLWRATDLERHFFLSHENCSDITCYNVTLALRSPLQRAHMEETIRHMYRKFPNLRGVQLRDQDGELWMCEMKEENIFLEFCENGKDYEDRFIQETRKRHNVETGPMWRMTVMPVEGAMDEDAKAEGFGFQYQLLFGLHHAITDGHCTMRMCGFLVSFLNDVIEGKEIDDEKQLAEFVGDVHQIRIEKEVRDQLDKDPALYKRVKDDLAEYSKFTPLYFKPYQRSGDCATDTVNAFVPKSVVSKFYAKAKAAGITVHSAFCNAVHAAIVDILVEKDLETANDHYVIKSAYDINNRRYFNCNTEFLFGAHVGLLRSSHLIPKDIKKNFWGHAKKFHTQFNEELDARNPFIYSLVDSDISPPAPKTLEEFRSVDTKSPFYFGVSNMGDITRFFTPSDGSQHQHARAVHLRRTTSVPPSIYCGCFCLQTLHGNLIMSFDYQTKYFEASLAKNLIDNIVKVIEEMQ